MSEADLFDDIFGGQKLWKNKYKVKWCGLCDTAVIMCPSCKNSSCNGGACDQCSDDFDAFHRSVWSRVNTYLSQKELNAYYKGLRLRELIVESIQNGEDEIDFKKFQAEGKFSQDDEYLFIDKL